MRDTADHQRPTRLPLDEQVDALRSLALVATRPAGADIYREVVGVVARVLKARLAMVAVFADEHRTTMRTLAVVLDGQPVAGSIEYVLARSPCVEVVGRGYCFMPGGVITRYPVDKMVSDLGLDAYAAFPMNDSHGEPLGLVAALDSRAIAGGDADLAETVLKIAALRLGAELERSAATAALQRSEASYRTIFEAAEDCIFLHDWDSGRFLDANPKACSTYGYTRDELLRLSATEVSSGVPPYTAQDAARWIALARQGRCPPFEWHRRNKDGSLHWDEVRLKPVTIDGRPHVLAVTRDITERKAAEEKLRASEEQHRSIFNASADAALVKDAEHRIVDVNEAYLRMVGYERHELLGQRLSQFVPVELQARCDVLVPEILAGQPCQLEASMQRRDGSRFDVEIRGTPVQYRGSRLALVIMRDITERKTAEALLRASEAQYRAIFNASADALILWDSQFQRVDVNAAYERMYGWSRDEVIGRGYEYLPHPDEYARPRRELVRRALAGEPCRAELQAIRKDGTRFATEVHAIPFTHRGAPHVLAIARDITERKAAEALLRASEAQYRAIFEASADALVLWNADLRFVDVNRVYTAMYGFTRDEVLGTTLDSRLPAAAVAERSACMRAALAGQERVLETTTLRKDGSSFNVELRYLPIIHLGEPHVLAIARDITERKTAESRLRASEEQYRAVFDGSSDPIVLWNRRLQVVDVSAAFLRTTGFAREDIVGRHWTERPDADDIRKLMPLIEGAIAGREGRAVERVTRADGSPFDIELRYLPVTFGGEAHALGIGRDVTEQLERERAIERSEAQYRAIFNASADALMLWDSSLKRVDVNPAHQKIFGYARDEVVGRGFEGLDWPPEMVQQRLDMVRRALAGEASRVELPSLRKDGERIVTELRTIPFQHRGEPHVLQIARDITDRKTAEAERAQLEAQLRQAQKMEAIGQLTGGIAHDFNNILTSVIGYVVLAQERAERQGDATLVRQLGSAHTAAERARELIAQMLAFARRQRGDRRVIALAPVLRQAMQLLRSTMPATIALDDAGLDEGPELPPVLADAVQIEQVLLNLCINARDAMQRNGRITVRLGVGSRASMRCTSCGATITHGPWLELEVADNGSGIAADVLPRVFEPFFSTKEVGRGSGMGLAMVHGIVHDHEGHIVVDSVPGRGSVFRVLLPGASGAAESAPPCNIALDTEAPLRGRVMLVEDEPMVAAFMRELLEAWGLEVIAPTDARAATDWFDDPTHDVDLLLSDLTMPQMNGLELAHHVGVLRPDLPVLLYSGDAEGLDDDALRRAGVRARLDKPIDPPRLKALLRRWLVRR